MCIAATETLINQKSLEKPNNGVLTFLILTFEEGIAFVVANFGFDQLHENIVPPLGLLLTRAFHERRSVGRLDENRVRVTGDLLGIGYLDYV